MADNDSAKKNPKQASATDKISETLSQTRSKVTEFSGVAADKIDRTLDSAASGLEEAASTVHRRADSLPGGPRVSGLAHSAARTMNATADFVREHDVSTMGTDMEHLVKKNPGPSLLCAAALGFLVGRSLTRN